MAKLKGTELILFLGKCFAVYIKQQVCSAKIS